MNRTIPFFLFVVAIFSSSAWGQYATFSRAGFHDCMLIYYAGDRDPSDFQYLVACAGRDGTPRAWAWDAFLFLRQNGAHGGSYENGTASA